MTHQPTLPLLGAALAAALACAQAQAAGAPVATAAAATTAVQPVPAPAMHKLTDASEHLRQAIEAMQGKPAGPERDVAIARAREALARTQRAMRELPPEWRLATPVATASYDASVQALTQAADTLRESIHAMARQPAGAARDQAIREANQALLDTQVAMANAWDLAAFPPQAATPPAPGTRVLGASGHCVQLGDMMGCKQQ